MISSLIAKLPRRFYLKMQVELAEDETHEFLSAVIMEEPPEDGWTIPTYFDEPPGVKRAHTEEWLGKYRHEDVARVSVTGSTDEPKVFEKLLTDMFDYWLRKKGVRET